MQAEVLFSTAAQRLGYSFDGEIKIGGNYVPLLRDGNIIYLSGQIPRVDNEIVGTGKVDSAADIPRAQLAAKVCVMRALALLKNAVGNLEQIQSVLRMTVYVQCSDTFTMHSEVADGASDLLFEILGLSGVHTRTSVGVAQLPKNSSVEIDMIVRVA
jgi:enamine deaminase RidA (YjgF/YER057c/UK114 family)